MRPPSLRGRVIIGITLWMAGAFMLTGVLGTRAVVHHPLLPYILHGTFANGAGYAFAITACFVAGFYQFARGLAPLAELRHRLTGVRAGGEHRIVGEYPQEVQPLIDDLNALLDHRERAVARAIAKAGDLAHGLKTPLAVIAQEADRARAAGHREFGDTVREQIDRMQRQIDYHLAHARAAASAAAPGARSGVAESADGVARALRRLHEDRRLAIEVCAPAEHAVRCQREDLDEMLGNLLENACKWAGTRVAVQSALDGNAVVVTVDDDGPGIAAEMREAVLQRGVRADEASAGTGFGLAIVRDLAELYGGSIALGPSALGGLQARLRLPSIMR
ncbi:MAG TPA: HAMP domain-containing sensor histidine kinase [Vicinamibacterales bacterium]|nr:HAMP domain-containing sensor histidine kinase [Vicinamibacterales bacterium]